MKRTVLLSIALAILIVATACGQPDRALDPAAVTAAQTPHPAPAVAPPIATASDTTPTLEAEGAAGAPPIASWLDEAERAAARFNQGGGFLDDLGRGSIDDLIAHPPATVRSVERAALDRLVAIQEFDRIVFGLNVTAQIRLGRIATGDFSIYISPVGRQELQTKAANFLAEKAKSLSLDVACGLAWNRLSKTEKEDANSLVTDQAFRARFTGLMLDLYTETQDEVVEYIEGEVQDGLESLFIPSIIVKWSSYAEDLYDKADQVTADGLVTIQPPTSYPVAKAYFYYVKLCLMPPGFK